MRPEYKRVFLPFSDMLQYHRLCHLLMLRESLPSPFPYHPLEKHISPPEQLRPTLPLLSFQDTSSIGYLVLLYKVSSFRHIQFLPVPLWCRTALFVFLTVPFAGFVLLYSMTFVP